MPFARSRGGGGPPRTSAGWQATAGGTGLDDDRVQPVGSVMHGNAWLGKRQRGSNAKTL